MTSTNTPTYAENVIFGIIAKLDQRRSSVPGKRSHAAMEDEDEAYESVSKLLEHKQPG